MKKYLFYLILISANGFSQNTIGTILNTEKSLDGYTLFSPRTSSSTSGTTYLTNNCGEIINQWSSNFPAFGGDFLMEDGSLFSSHIDNRSTLNYAGITGRIEKKDWNDNLLWGFTYSDTDYSFHHDYVPLPNGNVLLVIAYRMTLEEAIEAGRNPSNLPEGDLYDERIIEIQPSGTDAGLIVWEWRLWDHLIQDLDPTKNNFGVIGEHPELMDINYLGSSDGNGDWIHINSIDYNTELDQIMFSSRFLNEFYVIDHSTSTAEAASHSGGNSGKGGDFLYRWGNPQVYDQGTNTDQKSFGQHTVHWIPSEFPDAGKIMFFNNGRSRGFTSVDIINPPIDVNGNYSYSANTSFLPIDAEWSYTDQTNPSDFLAPFISGAYRLKNGNTLITNGPIGNVFEIDPSFDKVWEYITPVTVNDILSQGDAPGGITSNIFRTKRYEPDYSAFNGRDLNPIGYVELNPIPENCILSNTLSLEEFNLSSSFVTFPNPVIDKLNFINKTNNSFDIELFTIQGKKINVLLNNNQVDFSSLGAGLYILKINSNNQILIRKLIKTQ